MLINPKRSKNCGKCIFLKDDSCVCLCHSEDMTDSYHFEINRQELDMKVKPVKDLDHFRD